MRKKNEKRLIFKLFISAVVIVLSLLIFEIYLRIQYGQERDKIFEKYKDLKMCLTESKNPDLIYEFAPNKCNANSMGYIDYEYNISKEKGIFRIVVIGDSVAQGLGVNLEESFSKILERKLNDNIRNKRFEVIILAVKGYSTSQELILLENKALKYDPDLIIWSYVLNDAADPLYHNGNSEFERMFFKPKIHILNFISKKLLY